MQNVLFLLTSIVVWRGLTVIWQDIARLLSDLFGCLRYDYDVSYYDTTLWAIRHVRVSTKRKITLKNDDLSLRFWIADDFDEVVRIKTVAVVPVGTRSVLLRVCWANIVRGFTRTADDAIHDWRKVQEGTA